MLSKTDFFITIKRIYFRFISFMINKNMKIVLQTILFTVFLMANSCSSGSLTIKNNNSTLEYQLGSTFQIELEGDAKGENKWVLDSKIEPVVSLTNQSTQIKEGKTIYTFDFKVNTDGEKHVVLVYENENEQLDIFQVKIIAGSMGRILSN